MFTNNNQSPLEYLAAFAISAAAGAIIALGMGAYVEYVRDEGDKTDESPATTNNS
jgi:hypothetical protein